MKNAMAEICFAGICRFFKNLQHNEMTHICTLHSFWFFWPLWEEDKGGSNLEGERYNKNKLNNVVPKCLLSGWTGAELAKAFK